MKNREEAIWENLSIVSGLVPQKRLCDPYDGPAQATRHSSFSMYQRNAMLLLVNPFGGHK